MFRFTRKDALMILCENQSVSHRDSDNCLTVSLIAELDCTDVQVGHANIHDLWALMPKPPGTLQ